MLYTGFFDGSSYSSSGLLGLGFSIYKGRSEIICGAGPCSEGTINIALYSALIWMMDVAVSNGIEDMLIVGDSMLIINQINGKYRVSSEHLKRMHLMVDEKKGLFKNISFEWRPREKNTRADKLARRGIELNEEIIKTNFEKESSAEKITIEKVEPKIKVHANGKGEYAFLENGKIFNTLNTNNMSCTCEQYLKDSACKHIDVYQACISNMHLKKSS